MILPHLTLEQGTGITHRRTQLLHADFEPFNYGGSISGAYAIPLISHRAPPFLVFLFFLSRKITDKESYLDSYHRAR